MFSSVSDGSEGGGGAGGKEGAWLFFSSYFSSSSISLGERWEARGVCDCVFRYGYLFRKSLSSIMCGYGLVFS